MKMLVLWYF